MENRHKEESKTKNIEEITNEFTNDKLDQAGTRTVRLVKATQSKDEERLLVYLRKLPETHFHTEVVIPLFKRMGFTHIRYIHGASERGKDVVYVVKDHYGDSHVGVCQVKNEPFSGRADSKMNTVGLLNQLRQCRSTEVLNPQKQIKELPEEVVLLNTYALPEKDTADAGKLLQELRSMRCKVIGPEKLVELLKENIPELYERLAFPSKGMRESLAAYVNLHHEASAFGIARKRNLVDFYVDLGFLGYKDIREYEPWAGRTSHSRRGVVLSEVLSTVDRGRLKIHRLVYDAIRNWLSVMPKELTDFPTLEMYNPAERRILLGVRALRLHELILYARDQIEKLCASENTKSFTRAVAIMRAVQYFVPYVLAVIPEDSPIGNKGEILESLAAMRIPEMPPWVLLEVLDNVCIIGEAGAGKTCFARMLTKKALERNVKCVYFPCNLLKTRDTSIKEAMKNFIASISPGSSDEATDEVLKNPELIILDGCDEAFDFGEWIGREIADLAFAGKMSEEVLGYGEIAPYVPPDLRNKVTFERRSNKLTINKPLGAFDFERLLAANTGSIHDAIMRIATKYRRTNPRIILTSRIADPLSLSRDFFVARLKGFGDNQLSLFYEKWLADTEKSHEDVLTFLDENDYVKEISRLPMTATIIAALYENDYDLPHSRSDLYAKRFDLLLDKWQLTKGISFRGKVKASDKFVLLMRLALRLHVKHQRFFTIDAVEQVWYEGFDRLYPDYSCEELLWELQVGNGVVYPEGPGEFSLGHLSFQEFLVAHAIMRTQRREILLRNYFDPWWKNVITFYAGICGDVSGFLEDIQTRHPLVDARGLIFDITNEARFTSPVVMDFLKHGLDEYLFEYTDALDEEYQEYDEEALDKKGPTDDESPPDLSERLLDYEFPDDEQ